MVMQSNNQYSVFVRNADGGILEFYELDKMQALKMVEEMKGDGFTEVDMVPTFTTPYYTDSVLGEEETSDAE